jgi:hypothetical protein
MNLYEDESREDWAELKWLNLSEAEGGIHAVAGRLLRAAHGVQGVEDALTDLMHSCSAALARDSAE